MGARISLGNGLTAAANGASVRIRLSNPPFIFAAPDKGENGSNWTGSIAIQHTFDEPPLPNNGGGVSNNGITDANADWETIGTITAGDPMFNWSNPLFRVRALTTSITGGNPSVYLLENIRSLKPFAWR